MRSRAARLRLAAPVPGSVASACQHLRAVMHSAHPQVMQNLAKGARAHVMEARQKLRQGSLVWGALQPARTARVRRVMRRAGPTRRGEHGRDRHPVPAHPLPAGAAEPARALTRRARGVPTPADAPACTDVGAVAAAAAEQAPCANGEPSMRVALAGWARRWRWRRQAPCAARPLRMRW